MLMSSSARPEGREENNPWRPHNREIALTRGKFREKVGCGRDRGCGCGWGRGVIVVVCCGCGCGCGRGQGYLTFEAPFVASLLESRWGVVVRWVADVIVVAVVRWVADVIVVAVVAVV